mmetsp:Transcript_21641/g.53670  ORF Transcript_21641/g.53670 Transcript_21641/m.53670 type:complete len:143 (-) Transcript_21641:230-658(-)
MHTSQNIFSKEVFYKGTTTLCIDALRGFARKRVTGIARNCAVGEHPLRVFGTACLSPEGTKLAIIDASTRWQLGWLRGWLRRSFAGLRTLPGLEISTTKKILFGVQLEVVVVSVRRFDVGGQVVSDGGDCHDCSKHLSSSVL